MFVEGNDEYNFFDSVLKHIKISDVQIIPAGGKYKFTDKLPSLIKTSGFSDVEIFAVVRDADDDADNAYKSIRNILKKEGLEAPKEAGAFSTGHPKVGIFIMPGDSNTGMLEDLCLKLAKSANVMNCVDEYFRCCEPVLDYALNRMAKRKTQAYLAVMPENVPNVGIGSLKDYWDLNSNELNGLREFLSYFE